MSKTSGIRVGVDIGGTFTDVALEHPGGRNSAKLLTDYERPERAILAGIAEAAAEAEVELSRIGQVIHGTTLVTNALIQRRGAKTAFITTEGFRDVIEMRSENRFEQYDLNLELPAPLIAREHRYTLSERIAADGSVLLPLDKGAVAALTERIAGGGYEAVAVGFMHAYANNIHECMVEEALRHTAPELAVSISSVVSPQMRELPRFNTVIANAYVQPLVSDYLGRLVAELQAAGIDAPVFLMHSGGGLVSVETAIDQPVRLLESGPAGGAIYAAGRGAGTRDRQGAELRHGRHDRQDLPDRTGRAEDGEHFRGRAHLPVQEGLGDADLHARRGDGRNRRGRRLHRLGRRDGTAARRSAFGGVGTGARLLRAGW
jgi:N-methylhydantoinase A